MKKLLALFLVFCMAFSCLPIFALAAEVPENSLILSVDFENKTAENSVSYGLSDGEIAGDPIFVESYDGSKAVHVENGFSKTAQQYIEFSNVSFGAKSFSISFWYQATGKGGQTAWSGTDTEWTGFDNAITAQGGTVFSNTSTALAKSQGVSVMNLPAELYGTYNISNGETVYTYSNKLTNGALENLTDCRWHSVAVVVDRENASAKFYIDGALTGSQSIGFSDSLDCELQKLTFGADALGQYGAMSANFDDIKIYNYALSESELSNDFSKENYAKLITLIKKDLIEARVGERFSAEMLEDMNAEIISAKSKLSSGTTDFATEYKALYEKYLEFLNGKKPLGTIILTSDTHNQTGNAGVVNEANLKTILDEGLNLKYPATTLLNSGDYDENRIDYTDGTYFEIIKENFVDKIENATHAVCVGNHQYTHPGNNDTAHTPVDQSYFMNDCSEYIDPEAIPNQGLVDENGKLKTTYYYVTDGLVHYVVINQFENSSRILTLNITDEQKKWFDETLDYCARDGKPIFVIGHYPQNDPDFAGSISKHKKVIYMWGHSHYGFGRCGSEYDVDNNIKLNMPASYYLRSSCGYVGGGAYFAYVYKNSIVLRAYSPEKDCMLPEYDETIYFDGDPFKNSGTVSSKDEVNATAISGIKNATASYYNFPATVSNSGLSQAAVDVILSENTSVNGSYSIGVIPYEKQENGYSYSLYDASLSTGSGLGDGKIAFSARKPNTSGGYTVKNVVDGPYIGGTYGAGNASLSAALADGLSAEDAVYGIAIMEADKFYEIDSILISNGGSNNFTSRHYDVYISNCYEDLFEDYNKVFTYKQNKGMLNSVSEQYYYDWNTKTLITDPTAYPEQTVTWGNAQYITFNGSEKPEGRYAAFVARDAGTASNRRADIIEFKFFSNSAPKCEVNFESLKGETIKICNVPYGKSIKETLSPEEIDALSGLVPEISGVNAGRNILGEDIFWTLDLNLPITANVTALPLYSSCAHEFEDSVVSDGSGFASTCKTPGKTDGTKYECCGAPVAPGTDLPLDPSNHEGTEVEVTPAITATCKTEGFTASTKYDCCDAVGQTATSLGYNKANHEGTIVSDGKAVKATFTKDGKTDGTKYSCCGVAVAAGKTVYKASSVKLSTSSYTYDGKAKKPSVVLKDSKGKKLTSADYSVSYASGRKAVGRYKVTIKLKGRYSGTKYLYFTIVPKNIKLKSVKAGSKSLTVKWTKTSSHVKGYEIQYSTSSKFTKKTTKTVKVTSYKTSSKTSSKTIKKLKAKKKYYVRIRAYKTVSGKTYYSKSWSSKKSVTTKK